jgi:predicted nucleic acid-binding protein
VNDYENSSDKMIRIYLDNCCYNRPFDDQSHILVKLETDAKLQIQQLVCESKLELIWSFILHKENADNPFVARRNKIARWENIAVHCVLYSNEVNATANDLARLNIRPKDAWHVACAIHAGADYFISTDKKLLTKPVQAVSLVNPVTFLERYYHEK